MSMEIKVLYEDNHLIAVYKPAGVLSQPDFSGSACIYEEVKKYLKEKYKKPGNVFLGLVHRLDKPVSGIILFTKTTKGQQRLSEQFRNREVQKTYHALVYGKLKDKTGGLKSQVKKISFFAQAITGKSEEDLIENFKKAIKSREAELTYEVLKSFDFAQDKNNYSLLKIMPKTGRFHQIRIQFSEIGHPIIGDMKYGKMDDQGFRKISSKFFKDKSIALCATGLKFKTATGDEVKEISLPIPEEWEI